MAANNHDTTSLPQSLLFLAVTCLAVVSGMIGIARKAAEFGPVVGDVVAFDASHKPPFVSDARLTAERPKQADCVLDVAMMQRADGSLVVEERDNEPTRIYRAHWVGSHTSQDGDCGGDVDLLLTRMDLNTLAAAAGGFGVDHSPLALVH